MSDISELEIFIKEKMEKLIINREKALSEFDKIYVTYLYGYIDAYKEILEKIK